MEKEKILRSMRTHGLLRILNMGVTVSFAMLLCIGFADFDATARKKKATGKAKTTQCVHKKKKSSVFQEEVVEGDPATYIRIVNESEVKHEVVSQDQQQEYIPQRGIATQDVDDKPIFSTPEVQAQFPGGTQALVNWLGSHLTYPEEAWKNNIQGRVIVSFIINTDGSVSGARVLKGIDKDLDAEALRVVGMMPRWIPGKNNGVPVRSYFVLPISFKIPEEDAVQVVSEAGGCSNGDRWKQVSSIPQQKEVQECPSLYNRDEPEEDDSDAEIYRPAEEKIYTVVEQQAQFPGGQQALIKWMEDNINCPERVKNSDTKVRVIVKFVVEKDGTVTNPAVVKGVDSELDKLAIELIEKMPRWEPGKMNGVPVRSYYIFPVLFNRGK